MKVEIIEKFEFLNIVLLFKKEIELAFPPYAGLRIKHYHIDGRLGQDVFRMSDNIYFDKERNMFSVLNEFNVKFGMTTKEYNYVLEQINECELFYECDRGALLTFIKLIKYASDLYEESYEKMLQQREILRNNVGI